MEIPLGGQTYSQPSVNLNAQLCVNLYPIIDPTQTSTTQVGLRHTPGLVSIGSSAYGQLRAAVVWNDDLYAVIDNSLVKLTLNTALTAISSETFIGGLNTSAGFVTMVRNADMICITDGQDYYIYVPSLNDFYVGADVNFVAASGLVSIDGYFIFSQAGTDVMFHTDLVSDPATVLSINGLNFATAEANPDRLVTLASNNGELWAFGEDTVEIWYDAANPNGFAFSPRLGAVINQGCSAEKGVTRFNNTLAWIDDRRQIVMADGYQIKRLSTDPIEAAIRAYSVVSDAIFYSYSFSGHEFLICTFPSEDVTWSFDTGTSMWHERTSIVGGDVHRFLGDQHISYKGKEIVGGWNSSTLYTLDPDVYTEAGQHVERIRTFQHITDENRYRGVSYLEVYAETGVGVQSGQGSDPQIMLQVSKDGGHTYGNEEWRSLGAAGNYTARARWNRLGTGRIWTFKLKITDPIPVTLLNAYISVDGVSS